MKDILKELLIILFVVIGALAAFQMSKGFFRPEETREEKWKKFENRDRKDKR